MFGIKLFLFSVAWVVIVFLLCRFIAGRPLKIKKRRVILYITSMAALGVLGEVTVDTLYKFTFGQPLWLYRLFPIHYGYTSLYSLFEWGVIGFYVYILHNRLKEKNLLKIYILAPIMCVEVVLFELAVNGSYKTLFNKYIFYYFPSNLWHLSSLQVIPIYLVAGFITLGILEREQRHLRSALAFSACLAILLVGTGILINRL